MSTCNDEGERVEDVRQREVLEQRMLLPPRSPSSENNSITTHNYQNSIVHVCRWHWRTKGDKEGKKRAGKYAAVDNSRPKTFRPRDLKEFPPWGSGALPETQIVNKY